MAKVKRGGKVRLRNQKSRSWSINSRIGRYSTRVGRFTGMMLGQFVRIYDDIRRTWYLVPGTPVL